uniref:Estradiol 17-beta-dehydrogenase 12 n=1 Tax=Panagrellus redivivus TaxID=6233 RepID=A0A7E4W0D7_PANRE
MVCQCTINAIAYGAIGIIAFKVLTTLYNIVYPFLIAPAQDLHKLAGGAKWAVVTGSTDGIGKAYATELAKKGFNLLLVSRTQSKLDETKAEIAAASPNVEIRTLAFDFTNPSVADYQAKLVSEIEKIDVGVLVNNVGLSYEYPEVLHKVDGGLKRLADITIINTLPTTVLSAAVLPQMVERKKGVVINISSSASYSVMALWAVYSATKKYVCHFSDCIRNEYATSGITVQTVCPMMVSTKMSKVRTSFFAPTPGPYVKSAIRTIGNAAETTGCLAHQIQALVFNLPQFILAQIVDKNSYATRAAALRKRAKNQ